MKKLFLILFVLNASFLVSSCRGQSEEKEVVLETTLGEIRVKLYDDTPTFRDNFIKNVKDGMYDGVFFHRIIRSFMIQSGDPDTRPGHTQDSTKVWPTIPQEIVYPKHFHHRGALAAAKDEEDVNPKNEAHAFQFYIVTGKSCGDEILKSYEQAIWSLRVDRLFKKKTEQNAKKLDALRAARDRDGVSDLLSKLRNDAEEETERFSFTSEQKRVYKTKGGAPWLDTEYTVFGEVVEGMKTVLEIEKVKTDANDNPVKEVRIVKAYVVE